MARYESGCIPAKRSFSRSELNSSSGSFTDLNPLPWEPLDGCSCSQPCKLLNEQSAKRHGGAASARRCVPVSPVQEEHAHFGLRLLNSAQLITCTMCDEELPVLMGNETWCLLSVLLQGAVSPPTRIRFSDCRSFPPRPCCLAIWTSCQGSFGCFSSSVCLSFHLLAFAGLTFSLSTPSVPLFLHPLSVSSPTLTLLTIISSSKNSR